MMTVYRKNLLRIGIGAALLLCFAYLASTGALGRAQVGWGRWRAACALPILFLGLFLLVEGAWNLTNKRRRRLGPWAYSQVEVPHADLLLAPLWAWMALPDLLMGAGLGTSELGVVVGSVLAIVALIAVCLVLRKRHVRRWDSLAHHTICEDCGYILDGIEGDRCPECGRLLAERAEPAPFGSNILLR